MKLTKQDAIFKHRIMWCHIGSIFKKMDDDSLYLYELRTAYKNKWVSDSTFMLAIKRIAFTKVFLNLYTNYSELISGCFLCTYSNQEYEKYLRCSYMQHIENVCSAFCPFQNASIDECKFTGASNCLNGIYMKLVQSVINYNWENASKIAYKIAFLKEVEK